MRKLFVFSLVMALTLALGFGTVMANNDLKPPPGKHYNLNIIGFAQCNKQDGDDDCFKGNAGDIVTHGHTIFVPYVTDWIENPCTTTDGTYYGDVEDIQIAELMKGVRILVSDGGGAYDDMIVVDRDATDGLGKFILPDGFYLVFARALGKPGGCMDIDTILCYEYDAVLEDYVQTDCDPNLGSNEKFVLWGHLDVDRSRNKPHWQNATDVLLPGVVGNGGSKSPYPVEGLFDYFWQIYNNKLRLLQLRIYEVPPPE